MIRLIEARNYKCFGFISQPMGDFHVLIGANASGKSTFLDIIKFCGDIVSHGVEKAVSDRCKFFEELTFGVKGGDIEFALEFELPEENEFRKTNNFNFLRYEIILRGTSDSSFPNIDHERAFVFNKDTFSGLTKNNEPVTGKDYKILFRKIYDSPIVQIDEIYEETSNGTRNSFYFGLKESILSNIPRDKQKFPTSNWLNSFLKEGVQKMIINSETIRNSSHKDPGIRFKPDGSNLPWLLESLRKDERQFSMWLAHIQTELPDIKDITTSEMEDIRHRFLRVEYSNGLKVNSWLLSDGTLRLIALTLSAYINDLPGIFLFEEPEIGIHPQAIESMVMSLSSFYTSQVLIATHSTVILSIVKPEQILCFSKTEEGMVDVIKGSDHPRLKEWKGSPNLSILFGGGVLS